MGAASFSREFERALTRPRFGEYSGHSLDQMLDGKGRPTFVVNSTAVAEAALTYRMASRMLWAVCCLVAFD